MLNKKIKESVIAFRFKSYIWEKEYTPTTIDFWDFFTTVLVEGP